MSVTAKKGEGSKNSERSAKIKIRIGSITVRFVVG